MNVTVSHVQGRVPVTVLQMDGDLDASNYQDLIAKAQEVFQAGARNLLLDLSGTPYMSSSGLVALQSMAALLRGDETTDPEAGWAAFHAIDRDRDSGCQAHFKLLKPQPRVDRALEMAGFKRFVEVHDDYDTAVASF